MKLGNLLKKELRELLTPQAVFSMLFTCILLMSMGGFMGDAMEEAVSRTDITLVDLDKSEYTAKMIEKLPEYGAEPSVVTLESDNYYDEMARLDVEALVIIPEGFGEAVQQGGKSELSCITLINKGGLMGTIDGLSASSMTYAVSRYSDDYYQQTILGLDETQRNKIAEPVILTEYTAANGKTAAISPDTVSSILMTQSMIAPMAVFFLVFMASQMIMTAISTEKIDKTLETLMSAPVSKVTILTAKMLAAIIVALLNAGSMMVGFIFYMQGMMGENMTAQAGTAVSANVPALSGDIISTADAILQLGFTFTPGDIIFIGLQLFLTIAIGLSISLILGAMATDVKSVQTLVMPIMIAVMVPFFVTMFADVNSLPAAAKVIMYLIPFTHSFTAMNNLIFGNTAIVIGGLVYQLAFFIVCMRLAVKVFTTDLLFTMNFNPDNFMKKKAVKK